MSFNGTPLAQGRRLDHSAFLKNNNQPPAARPDSRLLQPAHSASARLPPQPSSDDDGQPALVRFARLKQREHASAPTIPSHPGAPRVFTSPPNPERWALKDTSVNVATAFHQAASSDMQTYPSHHNNAWASGSNRPNPAVPRSTSVEYEKETQQAGLKNRLAPPPSRLNNPAGASLRPTTGQGQRKPVSKMASVHHVPDSEGEPDNDPDSADRAKSPFNQVIDVAKRALGPATFYLRQRSQEPDNGQQHSSYDYSAEEREYQANRSKPGSVSGHRKNRISADNKAYKPSISDGESSEEYSDDDDKGRRRRKKKKKDPVGGPLTTLPVMAADKRKRRRSKGKNGAADDDEDDEESESETNTAAEKASNPRASVARSSVPPGSRQPIRAPEIAGDVSLDDAEQGLQSIPEVDGEDEAEAETQETNARYTAPSPDPLSIQSPVPFSIGAFLGRLVHLLIKTCFNTFVFAVNLLSGLFFVIGRILGTIVEIIVVRPLRLAGLVGSQSASSEIQPQRPAKPIGKYLLISFAILGAWYAIQEPNNLPLSLPIPSPFGGKGKSKHNQVFVAPSDVPANFVEFVARLKAIESAVSDLSRTNGDRANSHDDLLGRLDDLADRVSREARERKRGFDTVEGKLRDGVEGVVKRIEENVERKVVEDVDKRLYRKVEESVVSRVKEVEKKVMDGVISGELGSVKREMEVVRAKLAASASASAGGKKGGGNDEEARTRLRTLEERLGVIEGDVQEALELSKKAVVVPSAPSGASMPWWTRFSPSKGTPRSDITLKSADGQDITALLDQLITSSVLTHLHKDGLAVPDYALFSAGARVIPSLTSPTLELRPLTRISRLAAYFTDHGYALGRPPVTALHHDVQNGFCWPFVGSQGQLGVALAAPVKVESVTVDHVPKEVAFDVRSAPREMEVWGLVEGEENVRRVKEWKETQPQAWKEADESYPLTLPRQPEYFRLANFTYDLDGSSHVQNFVVSDDVKQMGLDFGVVVLMVKNNWGRNDFTCLYRFRVHGTPLERNPVE